MPPKKHHTSSKPPKPPKVSQAQESYSQSFQVTQYTHNSMSAVATQQAVEAWPSSQTKDIKDELGAVFKAHSETAEDKADKVNKTEPPELLAKEVIRIGLPAIPTLQEPMAAIPKLDLEVINLLDDLIFTTQHTSKLIGSNNFPNQNKDYKYYAYYTLADQVNIVSSRCKSE